MNTSRTIKPMTALQAAIAAFIVVVRVSVVGVVAPYAPSRIG